MSAPFLGNGITIPYRLRFDECGPDGLARTSTLMRYAQDIAWIHSEGLGFGRDWYNERGLAWVVRSAELAILAPVPLGTTLALSTAPTAFRRVWGRRRTEAHLADGTLALWGHTDWVMTDHRGMPGRIPSEFPAAFGIAPGTFEPLRLALPPAPADAAVLRTVVRPQDVDPMGHVNNAAYLDYLEEALLAAGSASAEAVARLPRRVRVEYVAPASPGAVLDGVAWPIDDQALGRGWAWRLIDPEDRDLARGTVTEENAV